MRLKALLLSALTFVSLQVNAQSAVDTPDTDSVFNPMSISGKSEATSALLSRVLDEKKEEKRYKGIVGFVEHYGEWITLSGNEVSPKIHISSYLLQTGRSELASLLLKNDVIDGWKAYKFMDGVASDFAFALQGGHNNYLKALFKYAPKGLNTPLAVQLGGQKVLPLSLLATRQYMEMDFYDDIVLSMLEAGANPHQKMNTGLSPMLIASSSNNMQFVRIVQNFLSNQTSSLDGLMKNTPLEEAELIESQAIADTLIEQSTEKKASYQYDKLFEMWVQMILKGYNVPADLMYDELKRREGFDINGKSSGGLTPLMAATMSPLYGGNVEYAKLLIERGADPKALIRIPSEKESVDVNHIQLALQRDNFKVVALMIASGVNFISAPDDEEVLLLSEAMQQKAYISASILKQALMQAVDYKQKNGLGE